MTVLPPQVGSCIMRAFYARFFRIEDFLDLFEQIALVVTKFNHLPSTGTSVPTDRIYPALSG